VPPGGTAVVTVRCSPTHDGLLQAWLRFPDSASVAPFHPIGLEANGVHPVIAVNKQTVEFGMLIAGAVDLDSITFSNPSKVPLHITSQSLTGADKDVFHILSPAAATIEPGASSTVLLSCTPSSSITGGPYYLHALLEITCDDDGTGLHQWQVNGGVVGHGIKASSSSLNFDSVAIGSTALLRIDLRNQSEMKVLFDSATVEGPDAGEFRSKARRQWYSGAYGGGWDSVLFVPQTPGLKNASLRLSFTDVVHYDIVVPLVGRAVEFPLKTRPRVVVFDTILEGRQTNASFWIVNTTDAAQTVRQLAGLSGHYFNYSIQPAWPFTIQARDSLLVTATLHGTSGGSYNTTMGVYLEGTSPIHIEFYFLAFVIGIPPNAIDQTPHPEIALGMPYPQPAHDAITIPFSLMTASHTQLSMHDALGRRVAVLADDNLAAGGHTRSFDARALPCGVYLVTLEVGGATRLTRRLLIAR
jgi:hypothetical protein